MSFPTEFFVIIVLALGSLFITDKNMVVTNKVCGPNGCVYQAHLTTNSDQKLKWKIESNCFEIGDTLKYDWLTDSIDEVCN